MNYHSITKTSVLNGKGIRVVLWLSGCDHHCIGCHNPETHSATSGKIFDEKAKLELIESLNHDYISGLTLSGGDPLFYNNLDEVLQLVQTIKYLFPTKTIWIYSGYVWEEIQNNPRMKAIINYCDILVDGKFDINQRDITLAWRGSKNQRVIDLKNHIVLIS